MSDHVFLAVPVVDHLAIKLGYVPRAQYEQTLRRLRDAAGKSARAQDLLHRIRDGLDDGSMDIPDVANAVHAEITELLKEGWT